MRSRVQKEDNRAVKLDPWGLIETEPPTKEHVGAGGPYIFVADVQLGLHMGPLTSGAGAVSDLDTVACLWAH